MPFWCRDDFGGVAGPDDRLGPAEKSLCLAIQQHRGVHDFLGDLPPIEADVPSRLDDETLLERLLHEGDDSVAQSLAHGVLLGRFSRRVGRSFGVDFGEGRSDGDREGDAVKIVCATTAAGLAWPGERQEKGDALSSSYEKSKVNICTGMKRWYAWWRRCIGLSTVSTSALPFPSGSSPASSLAFLPISSIPCFIANRATASLASFFVSYAAGTVNVRAPEGGTWRWRVQPNVLSAVDWPSSNLGELYTLTCSRQ